MKASKKLLSLLLVVMLLVSAIPFQAFADGTDPYTIDVTLKFSDKADSARSFTSIESTVAVKAVLDKVAPGWDSYYDFTSYDAGYNKGNDAEETVDLDQIINTGNEPYSLTIELTKKAPPAPTTYTATLKATLDGTEVGSDAKAGITEIDLTEDLAKSLYSGFDASKHVFKGWANGLSGKQELKEDTTFTAVFETIPAPTTYDVTVNVYRKNAFVTSQVVTGKTSVTLDNAFLKDVYADFDAATETAQWYRGAVGSTKIATGTVEPLTANATYSVNIETTVPVSTHNITVYAVRYVGNGTTYVNRGVVSEPLFTAEINGTVNVLDYLERTDNWSVIESNANKIGKIRTNPTFYTDRALTTKLKNETLTDAAKTVYVRVDAEEVKNVLLYVHKGSSIDKLTHLDPKVLHGYEAGEYVTYEAVQSVLGSKVKFYGLFTEARWDNLNASIKDDQLPKIQVTANGVEIHVWVYSGSVSNADSTNPKTGDYMLDTAVTLMVLSGLAAAAVYVVGKKRRV